MSVRITGGVYPALVTPFSENGDVDLEVTARLTEHCLHHGAQGFYVCGNTGQGLHLTVPERKRVAESVIEVVAGVVPVIVHVGSLSVRDACELATHAHAHGATGVSSILPPRYVDLESVHDYFSRISHAAGSLPLFPYFTGGTLSATAVMQRLLRLPTLAGTKYTGPNLFELGRIAGADRDPWTVFAGMDEQVAFAALRGVDGNIGSSVNLMPGAFKRIWELCTDGRYGDAVALQDRVNEVIVSLQAHGYEGALREGLRLLGLSCGDPRIPARPFDRERRRELEQTLQRVGFFDLAQMGSRS
jgi:dihydrodipicolinate synthase/N-acetylneuraminate lyase